MRSLMFLVIRCGVAFCQRREIEVESRIDLNQLCGWGVFFVPYLLFELPRTVSRGSELEYRSLQPEGEKQLYATALCYTSRDVACWGYSCYLGYQVWTCCGRLLLANAGASYWDWERESPGGPGSVCLQVLVPK